MICFQVIAGSIIIHKEAPQALTINQRDLAMDQMDRKLEIIHSGLHWSMERANILTFPMWNHVFLYSMSTLAKCIAFVWLEQSITICLSSR